MGRAFAQAMDAQHGPRWRTALPDKVVAHLGDGQGAKDNQTRADLFAAPHALTLTSSGDLYVVEWVGNGRPRKFRKMA